MLKVKSKNKEFQIEFDNLIKSSGTVDGNRFDWDVIKINENTFHIIKNNQAYLAEVVRFNSENKTITIKVNGTKYDLQIFDRYDDLLHKMGFDVSGTVKIKDIKAPMPGMVLDVAVTAGQSVKAGDVLVVLEAMKMENILKSPTDGIVKKVNVKKKDAVEKNAVLIYFE